MFFVYGCHSVRTGNITYGNNNRGVSIKSFNNISKDSIILLIGALHKKISLNPDKDYTILGCCYDSIYSTALRSIKLSPNGKKLLIVNSQNLRRDELIEDLVTKIKKKKPYTLPGKISDSNYDRMIIYFDYWEDSHISGGGAAPGGINEGVESNNVIINANLIYITKTQSVYYKNSYVNARKKFFDVNTQVIWGRLIENLFK